jgi:hypothetical protein
MRVYFSIVMVFFWPETLLGRFARRGKSDGILAESVRCGRGLHNFHGLGSDVLSALKRISIADRVLRE